jgi:hypothetical protein
MNGGAIVLREMTMRLKDQKWHRVSTTKETKPRSH